MTSATCSVDGCVGRASSRDMCQKHYTRFVRHGDPTTVRPTADFRRAMWWRISEEPISGCWLWTGPINRYGYGVACVSGRRMSAHRAVYEILRGAIPDGLTIDHLCRVTSCVNPWHMEAVPQGVNTLRGNTVSGVNSRKTHCLRGHPFDEQNTRRTRDGYRSCRACLRGRSRAVKNPKLTACPRCGGAYEVRRNGRRICRPCLNKCRNARTARLSAERVALRVLVITPDSGPLDAA